MERLRLQNETLQAEIALRGAELKRICRTDGSDILWPGDQEPWQDSSPWLFPIVGRLKEDYYLHKGIRYDMPIHGFAQRMRFVPVEHTATRLVLSACANEEIRRCYPFDFALRIIYELQGAQVNIRAEVENRGDEDMLFSLGGHPGLCAGEGDQLFFETEEDAPVHRLCAREHLLMPACQRFQGKELKVSSGLFREDALILHAPRSRSVTLKRRTGECVTVAYDDISWLGIWSRASEPLRYVCVEPWLGVDSPAALQSHELADKPDVLRLPAGKTFSFHMAIRDHAAWQPCVP